MDDSLIDTIVYKQWVSVDRSTLETISQSADDFVHSLCRKLEVLRPHSFIARQQSSFQVHLKAGLQQGEFLVMADFSENYSFVLQDAAQPFHIKFFYASDGAASQYKNRKNFINLCHHGKTLV